MRVHAMMTFSFWKTEKQVILLRFLYNIRILKRSLFTTSKTDCQLLRQKVRQRNLSNEKNTLCFQRIGILIHILSWRQQKQQCLFFITDILWRTFWCNKWRSVFDVVKRLRLRRLKWENPKKRLNRNQHFTLCRAVKWSLSMIKSIGTMRILERVQAFLPLLTIEIFYFSSWLCSL